MRRKNCRGYTLVFFVMLVSFIFVLATLVIDFGLARVVQQRMQNAADAAALEALRSSGDDEAAKSIAKLTFKGDGIAILDWETQIDEHMTIAMTGETADVDLTLAGSPISNEAASPIIPYIFGNALSLPDELAGGIPLWADSRADSKPATTYYPKSPRDPDTSRLYAVDVGSVNWSTVSDNCDLTSKLQLTTYDDLIVAEEMEESLNVSKLCVGQVINAPTTTPGDSISGFDSDYFIFYQQMPTSENYLILGFGFIDADNCAGIPNSTGVVTYRAQDAAKRLLSLSPEDLEEWGNAADGIPSLHLIKAPVLAP